MSKSLEDILRKVGALIQQADHPNTGPAEAEVFRTKAEALMFKYRIDETMLTAEEKAERAIVVKWATIVVCDATSEFAMSYGDLMHALIRHMDVKSDFIRTTGRKGGDVMAMGHNGIDRTIEIVGYESDIAFIQSMFSAVQLAFGSALEPKYDPSQSDAENCYRMRSAGMEGHRIAQAVFGDASKRARARKLARDYAVTLGEDPKEFSGQGNNMKVFRESYAQGFVSEFRSRLYRMRASRGSVELGVELAGRKDAIEEAYYARFPDRRPRSVPQLGESKIEECPKCKKAKSGYCRDHSWMRPRKGRVRYANGAAMARGRAAANRVDLGITNREVN